MRALEEQGQDRGSTCNEAVLVDAAGQIDVGVQVPEGVHGDGPSDSPVLLSYGHQRSCSLVGHPCQRHLH